LPSALLTEFGNAGVGRSPLAWEFAKHVERVPAIPCSRKGSVSRVRQRLELCARRVGKAQSEILEDDPPDVVGEKMDLPSRSRSATATWRRTSERSPGGAEHRFSRKESKPP
jgi:hypothetical protein